MSKAMLGIALIALNRRANARIAHDEVADFLQLVQAPAALPSFPLSTIIGMKKAKSRVYYHSQPKDQEPVAK